MNKDVAGGMEQNSSEEQESIACEQEFVVLGRNLTSKMPSFRAMPYLQFRLLSRMHSC